MGNSIKQVSSDAPRQLFLIDFTQFIPWLNDLKLREELISIRK
jgi:hypothetical protein